ncbi:MAG: hypothetical protein U0350_50155 [Caldilineaceae bacterium]
MSDVRLGAGAHCFLQRASSRRHLPKQPFQTRQGSQAADMQWMFASL